jgi:hypothetical protein
MPLKVKVLNSPRDVVEFVNDVSVIDSAAVAVGGADYEALDILVVDGGTRLKPAKIRVDTVDGAGAITGSTLLDGGEYTAVPGNPVNVLGGSGTGATFNLTSADLVAQADVVDIERKGGRWHLLYWV